MNHPVKQSQWRLLSFKPRLPELPKGLDAFWHSIAGKIKQTFTFHTKLMIQAKKILDLEGRYASMDDAQLKQSLLDIKIKFCYQKETKKDLLNAVAMIREAAGRTLGMRHYKVQIAGALAISKGNIVEMATGEGKTLTLTIPVIIQAWRGKGCHVLTSNGYLAQRDAQEMSSLYEFCHAKVGWIESDFTPQERYQAYQNDITYCTNQDVTADYLRDQLSLKNVPDLENLLMQRFFNEPKHFEQIMMRGLNSVIIDEADSLLIDDGITPLIISGEAPNPMQVEVYQKASQIADSLSETDYSINHKYKEITLHTAAKKAIKELTKNHKFLKNAGHRREELVMQALKARAFFIKDKQYIIKDNKIVIVDESTGRLMPDRTWRDGMHQAVEAKENLKINLPKDTYARISFQKFFRMYKNLSGVTGTANEAKGEFWHIYNLSIMRIPTHKKCLRKQFKMRVFTSYNAKTKALLKEINKIHAQGRPILIGTSGIKESNILSNKLKEMGLNHNLLNAVNHKEEANIVAQAGKFGAITISTNMAGRGTDIKLDKNSKEAGGLHVFSTERFVSKRIDRQLYGRSSRQGDPGSAQAFVSLEDQLLKENCPKIAKVLRFMTARANFEISSIFIRWFYSFLQYKAMKSARKQRKSVLVNDRWLEENMSYTGAQE